MNKEPRLVNMPSQNKKEGTRRGPDFIAKDKNEYDQDTWDENAKAAREERAKTQAERDSFLHKAKKLGVVALMAAVTTASALWAADKSGKVLEAEKARIEKLEADTKEQEEAARTAGKITYLFDDAERVTVGDNYVEFQSLRGDNKVVKYRFSGVNADAFSATNGEARLTTLDEKGNPEDGGITVRTDKEQGIEAMRNDMDRQIKLAEGKE